MISFTELEIVLIIVLIFSFCVIAMLMLFTVSKINAYKQTLNKLPQLERKHLEK